MNYYLIAWCYLRWRLFYYYFFCNGSNIYFASTMCFLIHSLVFSFLSIVHCKPVKCVKTNFININTEFYRRDVITFSIFFGNIFGFNMSLPCCKSNSYNRKSLNYYIVSMHFLNRTHAWVEYSCNSF